MSMDLLDRLITDIISTTEQLMNSDAIDLGPYQPGAMGVEKQHQSRGNDNQNKHKAERPMHKGVHRTVC